MGVGKITRHRAVFLRQHDLLAESYFNSRFAFPPFTKPVDVKPYSPRSSENISRTFAIPTHNAALYCRSGVNVTKMRLDIGRYITICFSLVALSAHM